MFGMSGLEFQPGLVRRFEKSVKENESVAKPSIEPARIESEWSEENQMNSIRSLLVDEGPFGKSIDDILWKKV